MNPTAPKVVVAGDVCLDWVRWRVPAADRGQNWQLTDGASWVVLPGGALLLAEMLRRAGGMDVAAPAVPDPQASDAALLSMADLAPFPVDRRTGTTVLRVGSFGGYRGPAEGAAASAASAQAAAGDAADAAVVVLDDAGNAFRHTPDVWPAALTAEGTRPWVVAKLCRPLMDGALWEHLRTRDPERLVLVVTADDLRAAGVNLSRQLSWERTAKDFVWEMACNRWLAPLANARHLVVRLGLDAAIHYSAGPDRTRSVLLFDPAQAEGGFAARHGGAMQGCGDAFTAALVRAVASAVVDPEESEDLVESGIRSGLAAARRLLRAGYGSAADVDAFPHPSIFDTGDDEDAFARAEVPPPAAAETSAPGYWSILEDLSGAALERLARDLVLHARAEELHGVPVGTFGALRTADRTEIEGLRSLRNLIEEYLSGSAETPLSVAVFGAPGSGKSFAVTQVAKEVAGSASGDVRIGRLSFNLSQLRSPEDLNHAFHLVRDTVLRGQLPLVFFDEFDAAFEGELGWLKFFLAPMQDGEFREGEATHPIGRAIFVFAGGTSSSFAEFAGEEPTAGASAAATAEAAATSGRADAAGEAKLARFRAVKGPDFVSRLRGYVDIAGPNPTGPGDVEHVVRRAMLLRSLIERKARRLLDGHGDGRIDEGILRAMLHVPAYQHGARSMEAILDMSLLAGQTSWEPDALPPAPQLALQVDAEVFLRLVLRDVLLGASREELGRAVHERYLAEQADSAAPDDAAMRGWEALPEHLRESNRRQADHVAATLREIGCDIMPVTGREPTLARFSVAEIETMAAAEHARWVAERRLGGWVQHPVRDVERRRTPYLVPYDELPDDIRERDRQAVRAIPELLAMAGFEVHRL